MSAPHIAPSADEERALVRYALRLLLGYAGSAAFAVGLLHLAGNVGAASHALALVTAGGAAAATGIAGARTVLRGFVHRVDLRHRQRRAERPSLADHNLGRRVG